ncbi:MAG: hypothetical protein JWN25_988 [Verrucomicrobiales bacterium]|nr:hypothetical protein [Verrucomicrobiales bacterium]MDB6130168.1 hypothetical protein [Verrucomicrobiales bacterium]
MIMPLKLGRRMGITLLETIVYIACLGIILGLASSAFFRVLTQTQRLTRSIDRVEKLLNFGERWRAEIRTSTGPIELLPATSGQSIRILSKASEITYTLDAGKLFRMEKGRNASPQILFSNLTSASFTTQQYSNVTAWSWHVEVEDESSRFKKHTVLDFLAINRNQKK